MTRMRVLLRKVELTGRVQADALDAGKIERSADALRILKICLYSQFGK
jgi:hypothetical protein